jgi:hypothetical protein
MSVKTMKDKTMKTGRRRSILFAMALSKMIAVLLIYSSHSYSGGTVSAEVHGWLFGARRV